MKCIVLVLCLIFSQAGAAKAHKAAPSTRHVKSKAPISKNSKSVKFQGGNIYEMNSDRKNLLFVMKAELKKSAKGKTTFSSYYFDTEKNEILTEEASFEQLNLKRYVIHQKQINEIYELDISEDKMVFSVTKEGRTEKTTKNLTTNIIIGPSFVPFMQKHWSEIQEQKTVTAELAVLDRMDTYGFEFEKIRDLKLDGKDTVMVRMKPSSTLVSSVVRPVYFVVAADGSRILELKGRMLPKRKIGSRWEDFEGEAVFIY